MTTESSDKPVDVLYFARLSDQLGARQEFLNLPAQVASAGQLRAYISQRGNKWTALDDTNIRMAVNQEVADADTPIKPGDEVAFFPPVTGG